MEIEKLATSAVVESISLTDVLSPFINDGDKEPSWDGNIYIYKDKKKSKKGIKKVPVQVKGETRKYVPPKKAPKFSVSLIDIDNWLNDGGIMLFVVLIDENAMNKAIYYAPLLPVKIRYMMNFARGKKKISVPLKEFPADNNRKIAVLLDFYDHMQKQTSFANAPLYTLDELEKEGILENISFSVTTYAKPSDEIDFESLLLQNDVYMYAQTKGSSVLQPLLDIPMDIHIRKKIIAEIKVKEQIFYDKYCIERYTEGFNIYVGKSMQFTFPYGKKGKFDFKVRGTLSDYIQDTKCFIAIIENREVTINNVRIPFDNPCNVAIEQYKRNLMYYYDVKKMLGILGVKGELECDELTDQDKNNIRNFTNALVLGQNINFPGSKSNTIYGRFRIANLIILLWADKDKKKEGFKLQSYFSSQKIVLVEDGSRKKTYPITHYVLLKKNDFLEAANIDYEKIVDDLEQNDTSEVVREQLVLFMLEMLKAYDEQSKKSEELLWAAEQYCEWLIENADNPTEFMELNRLQIIRRKREFDNAEILLLQGLRKEGHELSVRCGANILLGKMESAQDCFDEMADIEKESFIEYPICHFGRLNYEKAEN